MFLDDEAPGIVLARIVDRTVSFSYASLLFLRRHGFSMEQAFTYGIPYLSRLEEELARQVYLQNPRDVKAYNLDIQKQTLETREFFESARAQISSWVDDPEAVGEWINHQGLEVVNPFLAWFYQHLKPPRREAHDEPKKCCFPLDQH